MNLVQNCLGKHWWPWVPADTSHDGSFMIGIFWSFSQSFYVFTIFQTGEEIAPRASEQTRLSSRIRSNFVGQFRTSECIVSHVIRPSLIETSFSSAIARCHISHESSLPYFFHVFCGAGGTLTTNRWKADSLRPTKCPTVPTIWMHLADLPWDWKNIAWVDFARTELLRQHSATRGRRDCNSFFDDTTTCHPSSLLASKFFSYLIKGSIG